MVKYKDFFSYLFENTSNNQEWFHGTNEENGKKILSVGYLTPREITTKKSRGLTPEHGMVYLTRRVEEALAYTYLKSGVGTLKYPSPSLESTQKFGYLFVIDDKEIKIGNIQPDEDIIADVIPNYGENVVNGKHKFQWLVDLAKNKFPSLHKRYEKEGDYSYGTELGKRLMKYLTPEQKQILISHGKKVAHKGNIKIKECWKIYLDGRHHQMYKNNPEEFRQFSKRIY